MKLKFYSIDWDEELDGEDLPEDGKKGFKIDSNLSVRAQIDYFDKLAKNNPDELIVLTNSQFVLYHLNNCMIFSMIQNTEDYKECKNDSYVYKELFGDLEYKPYNINPGDVEILVRAQTGKGKHLFEPAERIYGGLLGKNWPDAQVRKIMQSYYACLQFFPADDRKGNKR